MSRLRSDALSYLSHQTRATALRHHYPLQPLQLQFPLCTETRESPPAANALEHFVVKKLQPLDEAAMVAVRLPVACWILPNCNICNSSCGELNQSGRGLEIVWGQKIFKDQKII